MATEVLTDVSGVVYRESYRLVPADLGLAGPWSIAKERLGGGRRDGVDVVHVDNGRLTFTVIPTRGMGLWQASCRGDRVGWTSPVVDGPVNPAYVQLSNWGGLGWLDGFDELMVRCGLESNGPPFEEAGRTYTLHGRIANIPAAYVAVEIDESTGEITVEGRVDEVRYGGVKLRLTTRITTTPDSNRLTVRDEVTNVGDTPAHYQLLYHWNLGPPHLEAGSRFDAPVRWVGPRDVRAAEGINHYSIYEAPTPGFAEQAYYFELHGEGPTRRTLAMLCNRAADKGIALRFDAADLPAFTLWKSTGGLAEGYVTGLEPATGYPNPRPFEQRQGRLAPLGPGESRVAETTMQVLGTAGEVAEVEGEIRALQAMGSRVVRPRPSEPFAIEA